MVTPGAKPWGLIAGAAAAAAASFCSGCDGPRFTSADVLGGVSVPAERLNHGRDLYGRSCASCHGVKGDGQGSSSAGMYPAPRDFTRGLFKFTSSPDGGLPSDDDLSRTVRRGLKGTHMPGWGKASERDVSDVVQYIKTFSDRWKTEKPATAPPISPDPWAHDDAAGASRGETVYHGAAQCWSCHPSYVPDKRVADLTAPEARTGIPWRSDMHRPREVTTVYGPVQPPDFLHDTLASDTEDLDLYRSIAAGVGGTPMPSFAASLSVPELWSLVHYVRALQRRRGTPQAESLPHVLEQAGEGVSPGQGR